jgi:hypothetical protein
MKKNITTLLLKTLVVIVTMTRFCQAIDKFIANQEYQTQLWRITDNPTLRDWANYHNTNSWSCDGRYICWEQYAYLTKPRYPSERGSNSKVYIMDLKTGEKYLVGSGSNPRWARRSNRLFYIESGDKVVCYDADKKSLSFLAEGIQWLGETDSDDRWLYGSKSCISDRGPAGTNVRIPIVENAVPEVLPDARGIFAIPNPNHPKVLFRIDGLVPGHQHKPFAPLHIMTDLGGNNEQILSPKIRHGHQSWSGDGQWFLLGNGQMKGRKWNEPFPSNEHYLAAISCGDISQCGRSGRWIVGSNNIGSMQIADLMSGDGYNFLRALSFVHHYGDWHANAAGDNDIKGSPDGTKVVFVSNYDLKNAPHTKIAEDMFSEHDNKIIVETTEGFPESGRISIQAEIIAYERKTANSFEGLTREMYGVKAQNPGVLSYLPPALFEHYTKYPKWHKKGMLVTSFDARLIEEQKRRDMIMPDIDNLPEGWECNPVTYQRRSDVYVAIVRQPDAPLLRFSENEDTMVELIPGENHWETRGYDIFVDDKKINESPLSGGEKISLGYASSGNAHLSVEAVAVEWSGLKSNRSIRLDVPGRGRAERVLEIMTKPPDDFSWKYDLYYIRGKEVSCRVAVANGNYSKKIMHIYDGLTAKEYYSDNMLTKRYDINRLGQATRRLYYNKGILERREYYNRKGIKMSEEKFDADGYIVESESYCYDLYLNDMTLQEPYLESRWFYERAMPLRLHGSYSYYYYTCFPGIYEVRGNNWLKIKSLPAKEVDIEK